MWNTGMERMMIITTTGVFSEKLSGSYFALTSMNTMAGRRKSPLSCSIYDVKETRIVLHLASYEAILHYAEYVAIIMDVYTYSTPQYIIDKAIIMDSVRSS